MFGKKLSKILMGQCGLRQSLRNCGLSMLTLLAIFSVISAFAACFPPKMSYKAVKEGQKHKTCNLGKKSYTDYTEPKGCSFFMALQKALKHKDKEVLSLSPGMVLLCSKC